MGLAEHASATHAIFAARTAGLMNRIEPEGLPDFLSGILIGVEIGARVRRNPPQLVTLLGDDSAVPSLRARVGAGRRIASARAAADATTRGQWRVAVQAGLVDGEGGQ